MAYTYTWANPEQTALRRRDEKGRTSVVPVSEDNSDYKEFVNSGASVSPYVAPPEPEPLTTEEKVNHLLSDYGLTRDELRVVLDG